MDEFYTIKVEMKMKMKKEDIGEITTSEAEKWIKEVLPTSVKMDDFQIFDFFDFTGKLYDPYNNLLASIVKEIQC